MLLKEDGLMVKILISLGIKKPHSSIYECVNRANSWSEGVKMNSFPTIEYRKDKKLLGEGTPWELNADECGGIIVFPTGMNAIELSPNKIAVHLDFAGWTIGHYLKGKYTANNGKQYGDNSLSVEIVGINFEKLVRIAEDLCKSFQQQSVLVKDYSSGRVLLVDEIKC